MATLNRAALESDTAGTQFQVFQTPETMILSITSGGLSSRVSLV